MPLYEYKCTACAHRFERIVKFSDPPLKTCPQCGKETVEQLLTAPAIQFKGTGWYVSDYARKGGTSAASSSSASKESAGASSSPSEGSAKESGASSSEKSSSAPSGSSATGSTESK